MTWKGRLFVKRPFHGLLSPRPPRGGAFLIGDQVRSRAMRIAAVDRPRPTAEHGERPPSRGDQAGNDPKFTGNINGMRSTPAPTAVAVGTRW